MGSYEGSSPNIVPSSHQGQSYDQSYVRKVIIVYSAVFVYFYFFSFDPVGGVQTESFEVPGALPRDEEDLHQKREISGNIILFIRFYNVESARI